MAKENTEYTEEQLEEWPSTPLLQEIYLEDKWEVHKNPDKKKYSELKNKIAENAHYCISKPEKNKDTACWCKKFKNQDCEGYCDCGLYYKVLRDKEAFLKMRKATFDRGKK